MPGWNVTTITPSGVALGTSSAELIGANPQRTYIEIQNQGATSIYLHLGGGTAVADRTCTKVLPTESWYPGDGMAMPASAITGISESGTNDVHIDEGSS